MLNRMQRGSNAGVRTYALERRKPSLLGASAVAFAMLLWGMAAAAHAAEKGDISNREVTTAVESEFWTDDAVDANNIDVTTQDGVVTLKGRVDSILAKERAETIAESTVGVRAIVNRLKVQPVVRTDEEIEESVEDALFRDPATDSYEVTASVDGGTVTLSGTVDSWQEKQLCATVVKGVRGVRKVRNNVKVDYKADRPDHEIRQDVKARLENDVLVDDYLIKVKVRDDTVVLSGTVGSLAEKNRAETDAWVAGVDDVDASNLEVEWWARDEMRRNSLIVSRSDEEIRKAVRDAFLYDPRVLSFNPVIEVEYGTVTLSGVVDNLAAKRAAEEDARNVVGVRRVKNHLKVRPEITPIASNEELERRVARALSEDPFVERWEIDIDAYSGSVYLSGEVNTSFEKERAEQVAQGVKGVTYVTNALEYDRTWTWKRDQEIREDVKDELFWSPYVDEDEISVTVDDGVVTLTGEVDTWSERDAAEENAFEGGAKDVRNNLTVRYRYYGPHYDGFLGYRS